MQQNQILVLGAYGLAGRTVIDGLLAHTSHAVIATGRDPKKLAAVLTSVPKDRCRSMVLDAGDPVALGKAMADCKLVVNTVGPYALHGAQIARIAIENGVSYLDCANEQIHYRRLRELEAMAVNKGLPMVTAAGTIPGLSTLLAAKLLENVPAATSIDIAFAQFRHAYENSGLGSIMSGVLDAVHHPCALVAGKQQPVLLGHSVKKMLLPPPFRTRKMLEVPTIDTLTLSGKYSLKDLHTWFYLGEQPAWLFGLIRALKPHKRHWAYDLIEKIAHYTDTTEYKKAAKAGYGPEAMLHVEVGNGAEKHSGTVLLKDGAIPMAYLPAILADDILAGRIEYAGLKTPLDLLDFDRFLDKAGQAVLRVDFD